MTIATGLWFFPSAPGPSIVNTIVAAEQSGLDEVWLGDEGPAAATPLRCLLRLPVLLARYDWASQ